MLNFVFDNKTRIVFGKGTELEVGEYTKQYGKKVLLHYGGGSIKKFGLYDKVVESLNIESPKTKLFQDLLTTLGITGKTLIVSKDFSENEVLAARNIPTIAFSQVSHVSVYDILNCKTLLLTKGAVDVLEEVLGND